ncbi:MAG: hypothetical protein ACKUBY_03805 [Candidatus Moraniibacteriota bacterium]|jgi:hypothetical protein
MNKLFLVSIGFVCIGLSFVLGMQWQKFQYNDICLDMGGGKNPGGHPICIVENCKND